MQQHEMYLRLIQEAVDHLPAQQQLVFKLAKEEQLSYEAIGQQLQISPLTVKTHMQRALQSIRAWLQQHGELLALLFLLVL
jgi:RNA polymerase sigma factor (sigma-70 family)